MSKILTKDLIEETMTDQGWLHPHEADQDWQRKIVLEHYDVELTDTFNDCEYYIYSESTADGYEVFIATDNISAPCIPEDLYYYDSDLHEPLIDAITDGLSTIYVDDENADFVDYAIEDLYSNLYDEKYEETEYELKDQGYKYEDEEE